jgi:imidazole glycerol-phosphate synthase subunit HisH
MIRATVIDAGVGNLGNLARALAVSGAEVEVTADAERVAASRCLLLPGVGAFAPPRERLRGPLEGAIRQALDAGAWLLGICVGYQLLFEAGEEYGAIDGLGLLPGRVTRLPEGVAVPHVGWNRLERADGVAVGGEGDAGTGGPAADLLAGLPAAPWVYFVHSFAPEGVPGELVAARALHGRRFAAVAGRGRVLGTQFHPEKSGAAGLAVLANYLEAARGAAAGD